MAEETRPNPVGHARRYYDGEKDHSRRGIRSRFAAAARSWGHCIRYSMRFETTVEMASTYNLCRFGANSWSKQPPVPSGESLMAMRAQRFAAALIFFVIWPTAAIPASA